MSFEFDLVPKTLTGVFDGQAIAEMRAWWDRFPTAELPDGSLLVFPDEETRSVRLEHRRQRPGANDYLNPSVHFDRRRVQLSVVGDRVTDRWFHDFALWCEERWPCELQFFGEPVPNTDILAASES